MNEIRKAAKPGQGWCRPDIMAWEGTPIPPVHMPVDPTPERAEIAESVWWNGPAWTILRNGPQFVRQTLDFGLDDEIRFICADIGRPVWTEALTGARPGQMSRCAYVFWSVRLGLRDADMRCDWPRDAHVRDIRPLESASRADLYERHRRFHDSRIGSMGESRPTLSP